GLSTADETGFGSVALDAAQWAAMTPEQLMEKLKFATVDDLPAEGPLPKTYGFTTRAGGVGILQITGFADNPRGMKVRYKLVQKAQSTTTASNAMNPGAENQEVLRLKLQAAEQKLAEVQKQVAVGTAAPFHA